MITILLIKCISDVMQHGQIATPSADLAANE